MTQNNMFTKLQTFWKANWFKLILFAIFLYALLKADFHFQINVQSNDNKAFPPTSNSMVYQQSSVGLPQLQKSSLQFPSLKSLTNGLPEHLHSLSGITESEIKHFVDRFAQVATAESQKYGIPASVTLANALLHSSAGKNAITTATNNFFGLPCTDDWAGKTSYLSGNCFRTYESAWFSFRDHSSFLTSRLDKHTSFSPIDYVSWAQFIERTQYSELNNLATSLMYLIKAYKLDKFDSL